MKNDQSRENLLDAQTIFKYNMIKKKNPNVKIVTELFFHENLAYLNYFKNDPDTFILNRDYGYDQTPTFASGEVYLASVMDGLIC